jgi:hypothetical protein
LADDPRPFGVPEVADDRDRLTERVDAGSGPEPAPTHGGDAVPERARSEAELEAAAAHDVERRGGTGEDRRRAQRQAEHVAAEADPLGPGGGEREQRPGVEVRRLVRMILERHQVEPRLLRAHDVVHDGLDVRGRRGDEAAEQQVVAVVAHAAPSRCLSGSAVADDPEHCTNRAHPVAGRDLWVDVEGPVAFDPLGKRR